MRKLLWVICCCLAVTLFCAPAALAAGEEEAFVTLSIPYPEGGNLKWAEQQALQARYADDQTPIPLNDWYDGYLFVTVPAENADRPIEVFTAEVLTFSDYDQRYYEFSVMRDLSRSGVITGNTKGAAEPFRTVSRAEAVVMVMRFLGLSAADTPASSFNDVAADAWYAGAVVAAEAYGIIAKDTSFYPDRQVTREEFTTMTARALWLAGLAERPAEVTPAQVAEITQIQDAAAVSAWALPAYYTMKTFRIATDVETEVIAEDGGYLYQAYATPRQAASRFECAHLIDQGIERYQVYPSQAAIRYGFDQAMPSIDGSTSTYAFTSAVYGNLFSNGFNHPSRPASHSKSHASYERLIAGEVDMLFASVYPASDILALAKEKGVELELIPIAYDAMIFFTNAGNPISGLSKEQISAIYVENAYSNWAQLGGPDALLYPYCRNNDSGSHAQMERHFLGGQEIHAKIREETTSISMSNVLTDVMGAQTTNPLGYALGYSIYYYFQNMDLFYDTLSELKLLAINGVYPTDETIADGSYPLANYSYIVLRADTPADAPARQMAKYMLTEAGQQCVKQAGYGTLKGE